MTDKRDSEHEELLAKRLRRVDDGGVDSLEECVGSLTPEEAEQFARAERMLRILHQVRDAESPATGEGDTEEDLHDELVTTESFRDAASVSLDHGAENSDVRSVERLGRFEIKGELGRGGFGVVLLAHDPKLGRDIALKIPKVDSLVSADARMRFQRESQAATILGHPAIVPIYESGSAGLVSYIAFGYCPGESLAEWFRAGDRHISPQLAARIVARLTEAVQHAHSRGVVHRDLKPANILLDLSTDPLNAEEDALVDSLRISDFGLSRLADSQADRTRTGAILGTPAYMSPEQARGEATVGEAVDIYALGAILYELLTGRVPLLKETDIATLRAIEFEQPASPRKLAPGTPRDLEAICLRCLEKDARNRYRNAQQLEDDLQRFLQQQPVTARPVGPLVRLSRWCRRDPIVAGALSVALAALITGLAFSITFAVRAERSRTLADQKQQLADARSAEALAQAKFARQAVDQLQRAIADEPAIHAQGMEKFKQKLVAASKDYYQLIVTQRPGDRDVLLEYIDTLKGLAYLQQLLGEHETSTAIWEQAAGILADEFPEDLPGWVSIRSKIAENLMIRGKVDEAVKITSDVVQRLQQATDDSRSEEVVKNLITQLVSSAQNLSVQGNDKQANEVIDQAIDLVTQFTRQPPEQWPAYRIWGRVLRCKSEIAWKLGEHDAVDRFAPLSIGIYQQVMSDAPERTSEALDSMASMHQVLGISKKMQGQMQEAIDQFEKEGQLHQQLMRCHQDVAILAFNWSNHIHRYGQTLYAAGKIGEADQLLTPHLDWLKERQEQYPQLSFLLGISEVECRELMSVIDQQQGRAVQSQHQLDLAIQVSDELCRSDQAPLGLKAVRGNLYTRKAERLLKSGDAQQASQFLAKSIGILQPLADEVQVGEPVAFLATARKLLQQAHDRNRDAPK